MVGKTGLCPEGCDGCRGWRARLLLLWILSGVLGSLWFSCGLGVEKKGRDLEEEIILEELGLSKSELRKFVWLLSSLDRRAFNECVDKSLSTQLYSSSYAFEAMPSNGSLPMHQHEWTEANMAFHDQCPIGDGYVLESTKAKDKGMQSFMTSDLSLPLIPSRNVSKVYENVSNVRFSVIYKHGYYKRLLVHLFKVFWWVLVGILFSFRSICLGIKQSKSSNKQIAHKEQKFRHQNTKCGSIWRKKILVLGVLLGIMASVWIFVSMNASIISRRKETLTNMCDERARMLQDQFNVSMNHVHALAILVSTFHHGKDPSAINQTTFAEYTARTAFERPLTSGVAYALKVPHSKREEFEKQHGWRIKKMETEDQSPVQGEYIPEKLDPSPDQPVYAPVIFSQETVSHIVSIDMMSGKFTEQGHIFVSVHLVEEVKSACDINSCVLKQNPEVIKDCKDVSCITLSGFPIVGRWNCWDNFKMFRGSTELMETINLLVAVEDTGVGIPQDAQNRIFMPFMQADSSTSRTYGGTGIGLSISKCLVDLMSGEIGFVSKPSIGSTFAFTAVFSEGRKKTEDIKRHQSDPPLLDFRGMKGLVVDGRCIRAEVTRYHLQRLGMQVDIVIKSEAAVSLILEDCQSSGLAHLDTVLVDKEAFGEGSGLAFVCSLTRLMQNGSLKLHRSPPKIILLAISLSPVEIDELKLAGVSSVIKPLRLNMMVACLQRVLGVGNKRQHDKGKPLALQSLLNGKHILVVDDNAVNRKVAAGALKKYRAIVTCVDSGKAALHLLQPPHNFDACFMDVQMPEMDGFEATKKIRSMESEINELIKAGAVEREMYGNVDYWHVPILAMTADVFQATHDECVRCGMDDYVSKPFEEEQLYSAVSHFFEYDKIDQVS